MEFYAVMQYIEKDCGIIGDFVNGELPEIRISETHYFECYADTDRAESLMLITEVDGDILREFILKLPKYNPSTHHALPELDMFIHFREFSHVYKKMFGVEIPLGAIVKAEEALYEKWCQ